MKQNQIAKAVDVSQSYISTIMAGKKKPDIRTAIKIEKTLGYPNNILTLEKMGFEDVIFYLTNERNVEVKKNFKDFNIEN